MRLLRFLFCVLFVFLTTLNAKEEGFDLTCETISIKTITGSKKYRSLENFDPGHHKTLIKLHKYPDESNFVFTYYRHIFPNEKRQIAPMENLVYNGTTIGEKIPTMFISSRGYLPGEKVCVVVSTKDNRWASKPIIFFPNPLVKKDKHSRAKITAELAIRIPTNYEFKFEGFREGETLKCTSFSSGELLNSEFICKKGNAFLYAPAVIGKEGGVSRITFERENGDRISFSIPWESEFSHHLRGDKKPLVTSF